MTVGEWVGTLLLMMIPVVNLILGLVWVFGGGVNRNKQHLVRAYLLLTFILLLLWLLFVTVLFMTGALAADHFTTWGQAI